MKFGQVSNPEKIDFKLPRDHKDTQRVLSKGKKKLKIFVGCAKWNKSDLKNFYPKGTKDELSYYSSQFNSIELNATFYSMPTPSQVKIWKDKTPKNFKFFPKLTNTISHFKRLKDVKDPVNLFCHAINHFDTRLGIPFLQLHDNFKPKDFARVESFLKEYPKGMPLAIEVRNKEWFDDRVVAEKYFNLLEKYKVSNIIVDTAGRRDLLHMRLTCSSAFVRYVGANHPTDYKRLDTWVKRIKKWQGEGLENLYFFIHQNVEKASPLLSAYFIEKINKELGCKLHIPETIQSKIKY